MKVGYLRLSGSSPCHPAMMATGADETGRTDRTRRPVARSLGRVRELPLDPAGTIASMATPTIIFLRHGQAEDDDGGGDAARPLTPKGIAQGESAGIAIAKLGLAPEACLTSPRVRAFDTAKAACLALDLEPVVEESLGGGGFRGDALAAGFESVLMVGHEPTFSGEVGRLTGGSVRLRKGGIAVVRSSRLELLAGPDLLALAARA